MSKRRRRRRFSPDFKKEAVAYLQDSGKLLAEAAADLGISKSSLSRWRDQLEGVPDEEPSGESAEQELERLRKRVRRLEEEREILKKAAAFFARESE